MVTSLEIVLVEDHDHLRRVTAEVLRERGHQVVALASAEEVDDSITLFKPDLYILDLNLPGEDGLSLSRRIRATQPRVGIIMTTVRREIQHRLGGYESGADLYLPKPIDVDELSMAVGSLGRRVRDPLGETVLVEGGLSLSKPASPEQAELFERPAGVAWSSYPSVVDSQLTVVTLDLPGLKILGVRRSESVSPAEGRLLCALSRAHNRQLERWQVAAMLGQGEDFSAASLEVRVGRLRKKLLSVSGESRPLRAERGFGYRLCLRVLVID